MESIEKLREFIGDRAAYKTTVWEKGHAIADEIEREIAEKYMLLPVDADGVPWNLTEKGFIDPQGNNKGLREIIFNTATERWELLGSDSYVSVASKCRHVKPLTVEDVLREFANSGTPTGNGGVLFETALIEKYADKLRDLFGGDAS